MKHRIGGGQLFRLGPLPLTLPVAITLVLQTTLSHAQRADTDKILTEEVIVIGSKDNTTRQDLATSLGYFDSERIENEPIFNLEDIFDRTANAFTGTASEGAYSIRGISNNGVTGTYNNSNALASVLINQVALGVSSGDLVKPSLFDAQSVEVLRGPQSATQGPNALAGAIYINYKKPSFEGYEGRARLEIGQFDTLNAGLVQNFEIVDDVLATRLILEKRETDGDVENITTGSDDVNRIDDQNVRIMFRLNPKADDSLAIDLSYLNTDSESNPFPGVFPVGDRDLFERLQTANIESEFETDFDMLTLEANWQVSERIGLTSVTGYSDFSNDQFFDGDLTEFDLLAVNLGIAEELFSQEFRVNYSGDNFSFLGGLFYSDGDYEFGFSGDGVFPGPTGEFIPFRTATRNTETIEQFAIFGKASWQVSDVVELTFGLRFNQEERDTSNFADNDGFVTDFSGDETFDQLIPSLSLSYDLSDETSIGLSYAQGFQAGGIAFAILLGEARPYDEEFTDNYEIFIRHRSTDGRLVANANFFYIDWTDQQVTALLPGGIPGFDDLVFNSGSSSVAGFEADVEWRFNQELSTFISVGYTDTEFEEFDFNGVDFSGESFPRAPEFNAAIGFNYLSQSGWFAAGTYSYVDDTYTGVGLPAITELSDRNLLSGRFGYRTDSWKAYLMGTNLLDDEYELSLFDGSVVGIPGAYGPVTRPRTIAVGFDIGW